MVKDMQIKLVPRSGHLGLQFPFPRKNRIQAFAGLMHLLPSSLCSNDSFTEKCPLMTLTKITTPTTYTPPLLLSISLLGLVCMSGNLSCSQM